MPLSQASDIKAPELVSWSLIVSTVDITSQPGAPIVEFSVRDESFIQTPNLNLASQSSSQTSGFATVERIKTDGQTVTFRAQGLIPVTGAQGIWTWNLYPLRDNIGNSSQGFPVSGMNSGYSNQVTVKSSTVSDTKPPTLISWNLITTSVDLTLGVGRPVVEFTVQDDSRIETPNLNLASQSSTQTSGFAQMELLSSTTNSATYRATGSIPVNGATGTWTWNLYPLRDSVGNSSQGFPVSGTNSGYKNSIQVENAESKLLKASADSKAKQEAEAKAAADLKAKQEAEAKAAADLKAKQEAEAKAATDKAAAAIAAANAATDAANARIDAANKAAELAALVAAAEAKAAEAQAKAKAIELKLAKPKLITITCIKGKLMKKVTAAKPMCPSGYKLKK